MASPNAQRPTPNAQAPTRSAQRPTGRVVKVVRLDTAGESEVARLIDEVPTADMVVMVATAGVTPDAIARVGRACSDARVVTTTLVIRRPDASDEALSRTLACVRPWSLMVVVAGEAGYLDDILRSFR